MKEQTKQEIIDRIDSPEDLRRLTIDELNLLAGEIRRRIIDTVAANGGHLAPSLGTVELTLALHYVFDTPRDRLIWDVGHQAYAHKLVTGRRDRFHTLRRKDGISGFPKRKESPYDVFDAGHSSTSLSAASGIAEARCLKGEKHKVIAVIGDGSMTAGMAYEAMNWAGDREKDLIIVLNDNEMSISPNVGAMSAYLNRVMTGKEVTRLKSGVLHVLKSLPGGEQMIKFTRQVEESLKAFVVPGMLFEELGFQYVGPLEGHRLDYLIRNLQNVAQLNRPVLVHVVTRKGKGCPFAEAEPCRYHGVGPFDRETGAVLVKPDAPPSYTEIFGRTMIRLASEDPRITAITAAMGTGTGLDEYAARFPDRFFDVGIAEQHGVTFAAGLAVEGFIPVVAIYSTFLQRAFDQVLHDVCLQNLHVVFALDRGGFVGEDGPTHHGLFDLAYLRSIPNMVVMAPKDENEFQHMLKTATEHRGPIAVRYPRGAGAGVPLDTDLSSLPIGKGEILMDGGDVTIVALGTTVEPARAAAERLKAEGIGATVVNGRFAKPLDRELLCETAARTGRVLTVEENVLMGGFGSAVLECFQEAGLRDVRIRRLGIGDEFVEQATQKELRRLHGIDEEGIYRAALEMVRAS
ncbi:MAG TPA: 1-deoxy-D-xylulose-5-phosphate synthase [Syntrophales bacterium]|nr:1-deoxy-D-xylulose-5-phosphate synthase [Syntrophales bacterium]